MRPLNNFSSSAPCMISKVEIYSPIRSRTGTPSSASTWPHHPEQSANTLYFSLQPATALTDTQRLLIGGPTAPTESLPKDLNQPDELKNRILKQTAKLASESSKRATAEEKAKREAESKIKLISGAVHHLNNPMNHILGAYELVQREMMT